MALDALEDAKISHAEMTRGRIERKPERRVRQKVAEAAAATADRAILRELERYGISDGRLIPVETRLKMNGMGARLDLGTYPDPCGQPVERKPSEEARP